MIQWNRRPRAATEETRPAEATTENQRNCLMTTSCIYTSHIRWVIHFYTILLTQYLHVLSSRQITQFYLYYHHSNTISTILKKLKIKIFDHNQEENVATARCIMKHSSLLTRFSLRGRCPLAFRPTLETPSIPKWRPRHLKTCQVSWNLWKITTLKSYLPHPCYY